MALDAGTLEIKIVATNKDAIEAVDDLDEKIEQTEEDTDTLGDTGNSTGKRLKEAFEKGTGSIGKMIGKIALVTAALKTVADGLVNLGHKADDLLTKSVVTGIEVEDLQEWAYASQFIDTEVETITSSMTKMKRSMLDAMEGTDTAVKAFKNLGVSVADADGNMRDQQDVFWEAIDALSKIENETLRDAYAMDIFGRSAQELNPLIKAGREEWEKYAEEAHEAGIILSDDQVAWAGEFDDNMNTLKSTFKGMLENILSAVMPAINHLLAIINPILQGIGKIIQEISQLVGSLIADGTVLGWIISAVQTVIGWFQSAASAITGFFNLDWSSIGANIINGIINGLKSAASALWEACKNIANKVLGFFKNIFGIASPSKVTAEYGKYLDEGLAKGMTEAVETPVESAKNVAERTLHQFIDQDITGNLTAVPNMSTINNNNTLTNDNQKLQNINVSVNQNNNYGDRSTLMGQHNSNRKLGSMISGAIASAM